MTQIHKLLDLPETHKAIVGEYPRAYSLGICETGFVLKVEGTLEGEVEPEVNFPEKVTLEGVEYTVHVVYGFIPPEPLCGLLIID